MWSPVYALSMRRIMLIAAVATACSSAEPGDEPEPVPFDAVIRATRLCYPAVDDSGFVYLWAVNTETLDEYTGENVDCVHDSPNHGIAEVMLELDVDMTGEYRIQAFAFGEAGVEGCSVTVNVHTDLDVYTVGPCP